MQKEEFLSMVGRYYDEFASLEQSPNFYEYEKSFVDMWQRLGKECMEHQLNASSATQDRRKKNSNPIRRNLRIEDPQLPSEQPSWLWYKSLHARINELCRSNGMLCSM